MGDVGPGSGERPSSSAARSSCLTDPYLPGLGQALTVPGVWEYLPGTGQARRDQA